VPFLMLPDPRCVLGDRGYTQLSDPAYYLTKFNPFDYRPLFGIRFRIG
jgi:hypothetical protein